METASLLEGYVPCENGLLRSKMVRAVPSHALCAENSVEDMNRILDRVDEEPS